MLLFASHFLSTFGDRMWEFSVAIFMLKIAPSSLSLVAMYGLFLVLSQLFSATYIGSWVNRTERLRAVRIAVFIQNIMTSGGACFVLVLLYNNAHMDNNWNGLNPGLVYFCIVMTLLFGMVGVVYSMARKIAVELDWVVVVCEGNENDLSSVTSTCKTIDLGCKVSGPILVGIIMSSNGPANAAFFIAVWNIVSAVFEMVMLQKIYNETPKLRLARTTKDVQKENCCKDFRTGWKVYRETPVFWAGLALSLCYGSVLTWGDTMIGYLITEGMQESVVATVRGIGEFVGLLGAVCFKIAQSKFGSKKVGMCAIWFQCITLFIGVICNISSTDQNAAIAMLIVGLICSRFGLWTFDLSVQVQIQKLVKEEHRGINGGVQEAMQNFFMIIPYVGAIILDTNAEYKALMLFSNFVILAAAISYTIHKRKQDRAALLPSNADIGAEEGSREGDSLTTFKSSSPLKKGGSTAGSGSTSPLKSGGDSSTNSPK